MTVTATADILAVKEFTQVNMFHILFLIKEVKM